MQIKTFPLGPLETNCYLLHTDAQAVCIDAGGPPAPLVRYLERNKLTLTHILSTHLHFDHIYGNAALQAATGAAILACADDGYLLESAYGKGGDYGLPPVEPFDFTPLEPGSLTLLEGECRVFPTPGHTLGSLSFYWEKAGALFAGDVLFQRSVGRTDLPGGDTDTLLQTIREKLFTLPENTTVYPGHGPATSIGEEKRCNPFVGVRAFS
jgi:glyoxylase-like metal-dependent hydrolase (beta-lactamase superfamily II)